MKTLVVYLPPTEAETTLAYDYVLTADGHTASDHACVAPSLLPPAARGGEVVAVVPVTLLSWHSVDLPKGIGAGSARLRPVLEGLLEDRLLDDAAHMHLALAPAASAGSGRVWVAACDKTWLRRHLQALEAAGRRVARVVPEFAPDIGPLRLHAISDDNLSQLIMTGGGARGVMRLPLTPAALALVPDSSADEDVLVFAEPAVAELAEQLLQRKVGLITRPQRWLEAVRSPWDLAQSDLTSSSRLRTVKHLTGLGRGLLQTPAGRPARWGLALLLIVNLVGLNVWSWQVENTLQTRRAALAVTLTQTFPQVKLVVDAPLQMERELALLRQASGAATGRDLEPILAALGSVARADLSLDAIEFMAGEARLKGLQLQVPEVAQMSEKLQRLGYAARQEGDTFFIKQVAAEGGSR
ncbi:MAG: type II secretion system protein GspL [Polaromonas sp.]|uniref:type II secretion system protein GspL n=1 Tax=Polaromonas sp. TaxID=1869339 RepID=UPI002736C288|nr:type II secretion system protein GspL [Polaromonas sp.]MDP2818743.1 type II secretion system protein GspL [Polaromonas sp.]